jgi:putative peptidoglycan lipid II flippase
MDDNKKMSIKTKQNTVRSVGIVFILSLVASLLSFVCEMIFAMYFGVSAETDAFTIASQIPVILFAVVTTSISTTVVPLYSKLLYGDEEGSSQKFVSKFVTLIAGVTIICVIICEIIAPVIVKLFSPGIEEKTFVYAVKFIRITFPTIIFSSVMSIFMGVLQVHKKFGRSSILTIVRQIVYAILIVVLQGLFGIYAAVCGLLIATIVEFFLSYIFAMSNVRVRPDFHLKDPYVSKAIKMSVPIFAGIGAAEINRLVDKIVASFLESGNISMLNYASKLSGAFTALIVGSISTVMFPYFAEKAAKKDRNGLSKMFFLTLMTLFWIIIRVNVVLYTRHLWTWIFLLTMSL